MTTLALYGTPISTYVRTVRLLLAETNTDYELKDIGIFNGDNETAEYRSLHPFGKVPTMIVGEKAIYETGAITHYLNQVMGGGNYSPPDAFEQARMQQIISIVDNYLYDPAVQKIVVQRLVMPQQGKSTDESIVKAAIAPVKQALEAIEHLCVGTPFLLGSLISLADFYLIPIFFYLSQTNEFDAVTANTPKLRVWWEQVKHLNSVKQVCA